MWSWAGSERGRYDGPAVGQEQALRRLSSSMARGAGLTGVAASLVCVVVALLVAGIAGLYGAAAGAVLGTGSALLTPLLVRRTAALAPQFVMLASFVGLITKMIVLLMVLFTLGGAEWLDRMSLAVTMLVVLITTSAAESWAGYKVRVLVGVDPSAPGA
ncbi:hypothetical protein [Pseudonocardia phyllosphaerae]|uniref:hypothetical protein n=1 Tax=Pseudonocardia phyllosphaerae TaxID=3390502 RepID=UPI00397BD4C3